MKAMGWYPLADEQMTEEQHEIIESSAEMLYGLIHARYILTSRGMNAVVRTPHPRLLRRSVETRHQCLNLLLPALGPPPLTPVHGATVDDMLDRPPALQSSSTGSRRKDNVQLDLGWTLTGWWARVGAAGEVQQRAVRTVPASILLRAGVPARRHVGHSAHHHGEDVLPQVLRHLLHAQQVPGQHRRRVLRHHLPAPVPHDVLVPQVA